MCMIYVILMDSYSLIPYTQSTTSLNLYEMDMKWIIEQLHMLYKHTLLILACGLLPLNLASFICCFIFPPPPAFIIVLSIVVFTFILFVQTKKRYMLVQTKERMSMVVMGGLIALSLLFAVCALTVLVYLQQVQKENLSIKSSLGNVIWKSDELSLGGLTILNLTFYMGNFLLLSFYSRGYYLMFWTYPLIFIFRYLKRRVSHLNTTLLANLPIVAYNDEISGCICSLCLENYAEGEEVCKLSCGHFYHRGCVRVWVVRSNCCPLCRKRVIK